MNIGSGMDNFLARGVDTTPKSAIEKTAPEKSNRPNANDTKIKNTNKNTIRKSGADVEEKRFEDIIGRDLDRPPVAGSERRGEATASEPEKESRDQKITKGKSQNVANEAAKPVTSQAAMEIFLNRMKKEVGVSPDDVLKAFAELNVGELVAPPEESAPNLIEKLKIGSAEKQKALEIYNELLAMTAAASMANYLNSSGQQAKVEVLDKREAQLRALNSSLDKMNSQFFLNGPEGEAARMKAQQAKAQAAYAQALEKMHGAENNEQNKEAAAINGGMGTMQVVENPYETSQLAPDSNGLPLENFDAMNAEQMPIEQNTVNPFQETTGDTELFQSNVAQTAEPLAGPEATVDPVTSELKAYQALGKNGEVAAAGVRVQENGAEENLTDQGGSGNGGNELAGHEIRGSHLETAKQAARAEAFSVDAPKPSAADTQNNVKEIISQAQFLAKRGGGEMKVSLSPEGIGHVNVRVAMQNGSVQVEMIASNDEAKKLLEKGLEELRENLAGHKLSLDSIKIDASKDLASRLAEQQQNLENGAQQRFLNDFKERNSGFRREMFEYGAPRVPGSQTRDEASNVVNDPRRRKDVTRRLDLVA